MLQYISGITKGKEYNLTYATFWNDPTSDARFHKFLSVNTVNISISFNNGSNWTSTTNSVVNKGTGIYNLLLTESEMNNDKIIVKISQSNSGSTSFNDLLVVIDTRVEYGTYSGILLTTLNNLINNGYTIKYQDLNNSGFNYYGLIKSAYKTSTWVIIRENIDFSEIVYCQRNNNDSLSEAWNQRDTINYSNTIKI